MRSLAEALAPGAPCRTCANLRPNGYAARPEPGAPAVRVHACAAFPRGIPDAITSGEHDHRTLFPGDHGRKYRPRSVPAPRRA